MVNTIDDCLINYENDNQKPVDQKTNVDIQFFLKTLDGERVKYDGTKPIGKGMQCYWNNHTGDQKLLVSEMQNPDSDALERLESTLREFTTVPLFASCSKQVIGDIKNPYLACPFSYKDDTSVPYLPNFACCIHYLEGLAMMQAMNTAKDHITATIGDQELTGKIEVDLMVDFNITDKEVRLAAKYPGNSTDVYTLRARKDFIEPNFEEFPAKEEADNYVAKFFKNEVL